MRRHVDEIALDPGPLQFLEFAFAKAREKGNGEVWQQACVAFLGGVEQSPAFRDTQ